MRFFIDLSYDGTTYHGWQSQPNALSVQEVLENALTTLLGSPTTVVGAGRTDSGVHAKQMIAHFDTDIVFDSHHLTMRLNAFLPKSIAIQKILKVTPKAHARFDAISRTYMYRISLKKNVFTHQNSYFVKHSLDVNSMQQASKMLLNYTDFQCFSKTNTDVKTYDCQLTRCDWIVTDDELHFHIQANRFLRNMVRAIVGTMINIGTGKYALEDLAPIIQSKNREKAGFSAPAHGLYLMAVTYPNKLFV